MTDNEQTTLEPPDRIWLTPQFAEAANVIGGGVYHVNLPPEEREGCIEYTRVSAASTAPLVDEQSIRLLAAERVAHAAHKYLADYLPDIGAVPRRLSELNTALDAWQAFPSARTVVDDSHPVIAALASLIEDEHATDHQRRVAHIALTALKSAAASPAAPQEDAPIRREIRSSRHPHFTHEDHQRMQEALDSLSDCPTEEEAESVLQACGTSGKEVVNEFVERLLRENMELKAKLDAAAPAPSQPARDAEETESPRRDG